MSVCWKIENRKSHTNLVSKYESALLTALHIVLKDLIGLLMGQFISKSPIVGQGTRHHVQFSVGEEGPPRYSSHHFETNNRREGASHQIPPAIIISEEGSRFVLSTCVYFYFPPQHNFLIIPFCCLKKMELAKL